jgi:biopolymer transport protein ExbD
VRRGIRGREGGDELAVKAEINVTSLVDVAFTLLVIFIITAPILQGGVEVAVPRADVPAIMAREEPFIVTVDREGTIFIGETPFDREGFRQSFSQLLGASRAEFVYIKGDSLASWGNVLWIVAEAARTEIPFGVIAEPEAVR